MKEEHSIAELLNLNPSDIKVSCNLDKWLLQMCSKTVDQLDVKDVCTMIRQELLVDIAIKKAIKLLHDDPMAGDMYEGQLIKLLYTVDKKQIGKWNKELERILLDVQARINSFDWVDGEEQQEYSELIYNFLSKLK